MQGLNNFLGELVALLPFIGLAAVAWLMALNWLYDRYLDARRCAQRKINSNTLQK